MGQLALSMFVAAALENNPVPSNSPPNGNLPTTNTYSGGLEDPKLTVNSLNWRFVDISRNGFMDQAVTLEQK